MARVNAGIDKLHAGLVLAGAIILTGSAAAAGPFAGLDGGWSGSGSATFESGQTEQLRCRATYRTSGGGSGLVLSLRCASSSATIDMHGDVTSTGRRVSGSWEERSTGSGGAVSGSASPGHMNLRYSGGASGSLSVSFSGSGQSVTLSSHGTSLRSVHVNLGRR